MLNDSTRTAAAVIATAALALLVACGGGNPSSSGSGGASNAGASASSPSAVGYSRCMRSHGVPRFPDPDPSSGGGIPKTDAQRLGVSGSQLQAAQQACQPLLPNASGSLDEQSRQCFEAGNCPQALVQQILTTQRAFAQCMRSHGLPKFPDPSIDSEGRPVFVINISEDGFDPHSAQYLTRDDECQRLAPAPEARQVNP